MHRPQFDRQSASMDPLHLLRRRRLRVTASVLGVLWLSSVAAAAQQAGTIALQGSVASACSIAVTSAPGALTLDLSNGGPQHAAVGTVVQSCNRLAGYKLTVSSATCALGTPGAKLVGIVSGDSVSYSVEFDNPATGGSASPVVNLLANACSGDGVTVGRSVSHAKIVGETSTIFVNYHSQGGLSNDLYLDLLTITMTVN